MKIRMEALNDLKVIEVRETVTTHQLSEMVKFIDDYLLKLYKGEVTMILIERKEKRE